MRPKRYPYSGQIKKSIGESTDLSIDSNAILQSAVRNSQLKHQGFDLKINKHTAV